MKYKKITIFCVITILLVIVIGFRRCSISEFDRIVGVIITHGSAASGQLYICQLPIHNDEFSFFDAFDITDGIAYFIAVSKLSENNSEMLYSFMSNNAIIDDDDAYCGFSNVHNEHTTVEANVIVFVTPTESHERRVFSLITVLQDTNGRIKPSISSTAIGGGQSSDGTVLRTIIEDSFTSIIVSIHTMYEPIKTTIVQLNAEHNLLVRSDYAPGSVADLYPAVSNAAYIIVETYMLSPNGEQKISRDIFSRDDAIQRFTTFSTSKNGVINRYFSQIIW